MPDDSDPVRARDVAAYVADVTGQLAALAGDAGLSMTEASLKLAQQVARDALKRNAEDAA